MFLFIAEAPDIRIKGRLNYGLLEANLYGFWGPVCDQDWTDVEADTACRELGNEGGYAYYAFSDTDTPMVVGGFNCSEDDATIKECDIKGLGENLGCHYPITKGTRRAAGVFCYNHRGKFVFIISATLQYIMILCQCNCFYFNVTVDLLL